MVLEKFRFSVPELVTLVALTAPGLALTRTLSDFQGIETEVSVNTEYNQSGGKGGCRLHSVGDIFSAAGRPLAYRPSHWLNHIL